MQIDSPLYEEEEEEIGNPPRPCLEETNFELYDEVFMRFTPANSYISALSTECSILLLRSNELVRSEKGLCRRPCGVVVASALALAAADIRQQQQHNLLARKSLFPTPT